MHAGDQKITQFGDKETLNLLSTTFGRLKPRKKVFTRCSKGINMLRVKRASDIKTVNENSISQQPCERDAKAIVIQASKNTTTLTMTTL